jgi:hypothetical protein
MEAFRAARDEALAQMGAAVRLVEQPPVVRAAQ